MSKTVEQVISPKLRNHTLTVITGTKDLSDELRRVLSTGGLLGLTDDQRLNYYKQICDTCGLNPATAISRWPKILSIFCYSSTDSISHYVIIAANE